MLTFRTKGQTAKSIIPKVKYHLQRSMAKLNRPEMDRDRLQEQSEILIQQNRFILYELQRINESLRYHLLGDTFLGEADELQTRSSFDYQWDDFRSGIAMADDQAFMAQ